MRISLVFLAAFTLLVAACAPVAPPPGSMPPDLAAQTAGQAEPLAGETFSYDAIVAAAIEFAAAEYDVPVADVEFVAVESVNWANSSLGCPQPGELAAEVVTPGYLITLSVQGEKVEVHTNADGSQMLTCPPRLDLEPAGKGEPEVSPEAQPAVDAAVDYAADVSGVSPEEVTVVSVESEEWSDASLGCPQPDMMYAAMITPGYRITLEVEGEIVAVHTNADGSQQVICETAAPARPKDKEISALPPELAFRLLLNQLEVSYPELADLSWEQEDRTPEGLLGHSTLAWVAAPWTIELGYAVVRNPSYEANLTHAEDGQVWSGVVSSRGQVIPTVVAGAPGSDAISTNSVEVVGSRRIGFRGESTLADGACLSTQLFIDDVPADWWPADACVLVQDGQWAITVPLGQDPAPATLDPSARYELRVWSQDDITVPADAFSFDLGGPAAVPDIANPASVYCVEQGGTVDIRDETEGQVGYCIFPDGSECEEWAYFKGECEPGTQ